MSGFTPEQERRVAEIVGDILTRIETERSRCRQSDLQDHLDWAIHEGGYTNASGGKNA